MTSMLLLQLGWLETLWSGFVAALSVAVVVSFFRLTLHPLARYPGPLLARLTEWVTVYQTSRGDRHLEQLDGHKKYGSIVRFGPNTISFNTIEAVKEIYTNRQSNVQKAPWYTVIEASAGGGNSLHAETDRRIHASHRRVMEHAFKEKSLKESEVYLVQNVLAFCNIVDQTSKSEEGWSKPFNMSEWSTYLNYDIMGDLVFGKQFNAMTSDAHRFVPKLIMNSTTFIYTFASLPYKAISRRVLASGFLSLSFIGGKMAKDDQRFHEIARTVVGERIAAEGKRPARKDIMHHLLNAKDPVTGDRFGRRQLNVESSLLIAAGADTTSLTLAAAFFYLLHNPRVMDNLVKEIRSTCSSKDLDTIAPSWLIRLPYLRAVIDETLRLCPPVPSLLPREVLRGGAVIGSHYIPEGTIVGVPAYAIHRNPDYFPDPDRFYPERWIVSESGDATQSASPDIPRNNYSVSVAREAFVAFSQGSRGCIGRQLAYYELHTTLAMTLSRFEIRLARDQLTGNLMRDSRDWRKGMGDILDPKESEELKRGRRKERRRKEEFQIFDRFLSDRNGPMVEFRERMET